MSWVAKYPERHSDPLSYMIDVIAEEATRSGQPLTDMERAQLRQPMGGTGGVGSENRLEKLIFDIVRQECEKGTANDPTSFVSAIEWIESDDLLVADLTSCAISSFTPTSQLRDAGQLILTAFVIVFLFGGGTAAVIAVIDWMKK